MDEYLTREVALTSFVNFAILTVRQCLFPILLSFHRVGEMGMMSCRQYEIIMFNIFMHPMTHLVCVLYLISNIFIKLFFVRGWVSFE